MIKEPGDLIIKPNKSKFSYQKDFLLFTILCISLFLSGYFFQRYGILGNAIIPFFSKKKIELKNFVTNDAEVFLLNISFNNYEKLMRKRQEALKDQILINNQEYVSGSIEHNNEKVDIDIRLKGDL